MGKVARKRRRPGRPNLPQGEVEGKIMPVGFTKAEAKQLAEATNRNDLTLSEWIRRTVLAALNA